MEIQSIKSSVPYRKNSPNYVRITGYAAVGAGAISVIQASRHKYKSHKFLAYLCGLFSLTHIGIVEYFHNKNKQ